VQSRTRRARKSPLFELFAEAHQAAGFAAVLEAEQMPDFVHGDFCSSFVCDPAIVICKSSSASTFYFCFNQFFTDIHAFSINQSPCQCADPAGVSAICITGVFNPCLNPG
jgi:hypothetical protein